MMSENERFDRERLLQRASSGEFWDVVVIGGGATGLGCALDAAARGHSTLLLEARDFAAGTSSRSTKLIHGGVRYLAQGRIGLVREALAERSVLLENAPELVRPQRFVVPAQGVLRRGWLRAGLGLYGLLAGSRRIETSRSLNVAELRQALPGLRPEVADGAVAYWDAQFDDARLAIALMRRVCGLGGIVLNHATVEELEHRAGRVASLMVRDHEGGSRFQVVARSVINATGAWADELRRLDEAKAAPRLRPSQGAHVVVDAEFLPGENALLIPQTDDGRVLFVMPWHGKRLIGTTDTPRDDVPAEPRPFAHEIDFLLETAGRYLSRAPSRADVRSCFAGIRPLIAGEGSTAGLSREHLVEVSAAGLVTVTGGKWTTYRRMAQEAVDAAEKAGNLAPRSCVTEHLSLNEEAVRPTDEVVLGVAPLLAGSELTAAMVRRAVRGELARSVEDVLARRYPLLFLDVELACRAAPLVARVMAQELGHDESWCAAQVAAFEELAQGYRVSGAVSA